MRTYIVALHADFRPERDMFMQGAVTSLAEPGSRVGVTNRAVSCP